MVEVSIIVPHYNDLAGLDACLSALDAQTRPRDSFEVIVADNLSPCAPEDLEAAIAGRARLVLVEEKGAGLARNGGVAAACGSLLAFVDCDCIPEPGWLDAGLLALHNHDLVGGSMLVLTRPGKPLTGAEAFEVVFAFNNQRYVEREGFSVTANLFTSRAVFQRVGGFRNGVSEDKDWCHRARELGYRIGYAEGARMGHPARVTWPQLRGKWERLHAEMFGLILARRFGRFRWLARTWGLPLSIAPHALRILRSDKLSSARERRAALATLIRQRLWRFFDAHRLLLQRD